MGNAFKAAVLDAATERLRQDLESMARAAAATREGATHEESRPENDKDTRGLEASYLARGQARRVAELEESLRLLRFVELRDFAPDDAIALSALVTLETDGATTLCFIAPAGGGSKVVVDERTVQVVTPSAPLGRALVGRQTGEAFEIFLGGSRREYEIVDVE